MKIIWLAKIMANVSKIIGKWSYKLEGPRVKVCGFCYKDANDYGPHTGIYCGRDVQTTLPLWRVEKTSDNSWTYVR